MLYVRGHVSIKAHTLLFSYLYRDSQVSLFSPCPFNFVIVILTLRKTFKLMRSSILITAEMSVATRITSFLDDKYSTVQKY